MGMYSYIERKVAKRCLQIALDVQEHYKTDCFKTDLWMKSAGAAIVAAKIREEYELDKPYRGDECND